MSYLKNIFGRRSGSVKNPIGKHRRTRLNFEDLEERCVLAAVLSTGIASTLASSAYVSPSTPTLTTATAASANEIALASTAVLGGASASLVAETPASTEPIILPTKLAAPSLTTVTAVSANEIDLAWTASKVPGVTYVIEESTSSGGSRLPGVVSGTSDAVLNLIGNTTYSFQVEAILSIGDESGFSPLSNSLSATTFPAAPSFTTTAVSTTEIDVAWNAVPGGASSYEVSVASSGGVQQVAVPNNPNSTSYLFPVTNLNSHTIYTIAVAARNATAVTWSSPVSVTTFLATPSLTTIKAESANEIDLSWNAVFGATGYQVEYSNNGGASWTKVPTTLALATNTKVNNLSPATTYSFRVDADNAAVTSSWSGSLSATTFPAAPTVTATAVSTGEIDLAWNTVSGASGYLVDEIVSGIPSQIGSLGPRSTSDQVTGLNPGTTYSFTVAAYNLSGQSQSLPVSEITFPAAPSLTMVTAESANEIDLSWNAVFGATGYQVEYSNNGGASWTKLPTTLSTNSEVNNLSPATTYSFRVEAYNAAGTSSWSSSLSATTFPAAPTVTATAVSTHEIDLAWSTVPGAFGYLVDELVLGNPTQIGSTGPGGTSYPVTGLNPGTTYSFTVAAYNLPGRSFSGVVSASTLQATPATITVHPSAATIIAGTSVTVTITALDASNNPCNNVTVTLSSNTGQSSSVQISNGTGTVPITLTKAETVSLTASYGSVHGAANVSVTPAAATVKVTALPSSMIVGQAAGLTVTVADKYGNAYGNTSVTIGGSASLSAAPVRTNSSGQATVVVTAIHSGVVNGAKANLTLTAAGTSATASTTVYPSLYTVIATYTVHFQDDDEYDFDEYPTFTSTEPTVQDLTSDISNQAGAWELKYEYDYYDTYGIDCTVLSSDVSYGVITAVN